MTVFLCEAHQFYEAYRAILTTVAKAPRSTGDPAREREQAWAEAFITIGRALTTLGLRLRDPHTGDAAPPPGKSAPLPVEVASAGAVPKGGLGPRQHAVLALGGLDSEQGLSAGEVATAVGINQANAQNVLKRLEGLGYLEAVADERPARWRRAE